MSFENEVWRAIRDFDLYEISDQGRIRHVDNDEVRSLGKNAQGFPTITLFKAGESSRHIKQVNRVVAETFLPPPRFRDQTAVWHLDGDLSNCMAVNLMWDRRDRVLEWNEMHRRGAPKFKTPAIRNNTTGMVYENVYTCALAEREPESVVLAKVERYGFKYEYAS